MKRVLNYKIFFNLIKVGLVSVTLLTLVFLYQLKIISYNDNQSNVKADTTVSPYYIAGKWIYQREACYSCHTRNVRKLIWDYARYKPNEQKVQHSNLFSIQSLNVWGFQRKGPDLSGTYPGKMNPSYLRSKLSTNSCNKNCVVHPYGRLFDRNADQGGDVQRIVFSRFNMAGPVKSRFSGSLAAKTEGELLIHYLMH